MDIDGIDRSILSLLRENGRARNVEIAGKVNLTEGAVRNRIDHLLRGGVIARFTVETNSESGVYGVVMLKARGETKKMMRQVSLLGIHREAFEISGEFDGCVVMSAESLLELDRKIDQMRKCANVLDTRTFISVKKW